MSPSVVSRVGINLLWLIPGVVGGSEEYTVGLLDGLAETRPDGLEFTLFAQPSLVASHPQLGENFPIVTLPRNVGAKPFRFGLESSWLAFVSRHQDLMHHGGGVAPFGGRQPMVVTIHDLQPLELPANFSALQRRWFRAMLPRVAAQADRIVTPSQYSQRKLVELLGVDEGRISVVSPVHVASDGPVSQTVDRSNSGIPDAPFLLYPAVTHPHKRHIDAVVALDLLRDRYPDLVLVLTGRAGFAEGDLEATVQQRQLEGRVDRRGRVSAEELDALLRRAEAMLFPSVYEGFGNPVLEAMARGTPVIAAAATSLPEVAGGAALLFQPGSPRALAEAIHQLLSHPAEAERLRTLGRARASSFDQETASEALVSAYRDVLR